MEFLGGFMEFNDGTECATCVLKWNGTVWNFDLQKLSRGGKELTTVMYKGVIYHIGGC